MKKEIQVIDLFCGGGGASQGFLQGGANVVLAVDSWGEALKFHEMNHPNVKTLNMELGGSIVEMARIIEAHIDRSKHFHLHGSPPCQAFSIASHHRLHASNGHGLVNWFIELVHYLKPDSWSMENVIPVTKILEGINYLIINSADVGVPQSRRRVIAGEGWKYEPLISKSEWITVKDVLPYIESLSPVPSMVKQYKNASIEKPFPTITSHSPNQLKVIINGQKRALTFEERGILFGWNDIKIPDNIRKSDLRKIVGNMITPPVTKRIIESISLPF